jgi:hypothetical protein
MGADSYIWQCPISMSVMRPEIHTFSMKLLCVHITHFLYLIEPPIFSIEIPCSVSLKAQRIWTLTFTSRKFGISAVEQ